jgi:hypothetical protein
MSNKIMENLEIVKVQINEILDKAKQEGEMLEKQIEETRAAQQAAAETTREARSSDDLKVYAESAANQRTLKDIADLYARRKASYDKNPYITYERYNAMTDQIMCELDKANDEAKAKVLELMQALKEVAGDLSSTINFGNELLHQLQHELYKDDAHTVTSNGNRVYLQSNEKEYNKRDLMFLVNEIIDKTKYLGGK